MWASVCGLYGTEILGTTADTAVDTTSAGRIPDQEVPGGPEAGVAVVVAPRTVRDGSRGSGSRAYALLLPSPIGYHCSFLAYPLDNLPLPGIGPPSPHIFIGLLLHDGEDQSLGAREGLPMPGKGDPPGAEAHGFLVAQTRDFAPQLGTLPV